MGGRRGAGLNEERDQTLNQLLTELDGFEGRPGTCSSRRRCWSSWARPMRVPSCLAGILLLAATNRPEMLDPALLRPGRLTRRVTVPLPDEEGRREILSIYLKKVPLDEGLSVDLASSEMAEWSRNFSGAELANAVNEAALMAGRKCVIASPGKGTGIASSRRPPPLPLLYRGQDFVTLQDLLEGVMRTRYGANSGIQAGAIGGAKGALSHWYQGLLEGLGLGRPTPQRPGLPSA